MKKVTVYFFLFFMLVKSMGGYFILLILRQEYIREEIEKKMESEIPPELLSSFVFSEKEYKQLEWERPNKEFFFKNILFDVVRHEMKGSKHLLVCLGDVGETQIKQQFANEDQQKNKSTSSTNYQFVFQLFDNHPFSTYLFPPPPYYTHKVTGHYVLARYVSALQNVLSPPPEGIIMMA